MLSQSIERVIHELRSRSEKNASQFLYHYTSAEAFMGICRNNEIWLGDVRFMNDPSELSFGQQVAYQALNHFSDSSEAETMIEIVKEALAEISAKSIAQPTIFAFSLCRISDALPQWRQYGDQGRGYSIGFRTKTLLNPKNDSALGLFRVRYTKQDQEEIFIIFYTSIMKALSEWDGAPNRSLVIKQVAMGIAIISSVMKDRSYESEQEWRLVVVLPFKKSSQIKFMAKKSSIKPYIIRSFSDLFGDEIDFAANLINSVTIGPVLEPIVREGVEMFISSTNYASVEVGISQVPIRDVL